jgi:hypothetical protein
MRPLTTVWGNKKTAVIAKIAEFSIRTGSDGDDF